MLFLPQYMPDLNQIKMAFAKLKVHPRRTAAETHIALIESVGDICNLYCIPDECSNYFKVEGYASN